MTKRNTASRAVAIEAAALTIELLDLNPEWLDSRATEALYEFIANAYGIDDPVNYKTEIENEVLVELKNQEHRKAATEIARRMIEGDDEPDEAVFRLSKDQLLHVISEAVLAGMRRPQ